MKPLIAARTMHERCLRRRVERKEPARIAVRPAGPLKRLRSARPGTRSAVAAKRLTFMSANRFLSMGGHVRTSEVPEGTMASCLRKLIDERPAMMLLRLKAVSTVMSSREIDRIMKLMSVFTGPGGLGCPSTRLRPEI